MNYDASIIGSVHSDTIAEQHNNLRKQHKKIITEIKSKDPEGSSNLHANPDKVAKPAVVAQGQSNGIMQFYKPLFKWKRQQRQFFHIIPSENQYHTDQIIMLKVHPIIYYPYLGTKLMSHNKSTNINKNSKSFLLNQNHITHSLANSLNLSLD